MLNGLADLWMQHSAPADGYPAKILVLCFAEDNNQATECLDDD